MAHIDTLKAYEELITAGVSEQQAKSQVKTLDSSLRDVTGGLATRKDLQILESNLKYFFIYNLVGAVVGMIYAPIIVAGLLRWFGKI